jgi:hypothetical protein
LLQLEIVTNLTNKLNATLSPSIRQVDDYLVTIANVEAEIASHNLASYISQTTAAKVR